MLAELEEGNRRRLAEATLTELELKEDVLEANQPLKDALSERSAHSQSVKSIRLINWVFNASTEVAFQPQVQGSRVKKETRSRSLTGVPCDLTTKIGRPNTNPPFVSVPTATHLNQTSINHAQNCVQPNVTQSRPQATNHDSVSLIS